MGRIPSIERDKPQTEIPIDDEFAVEPPIPNLDHYDRDEEPILEGEILEIYDVDPVGQPTTDKPRRVIVVKTR